MTIAAGFDLESTGADPSVDRIIEVALILQDWESGRELLRYVRRIDPEIAINPKASAVHGIMKADLVGCPLFKQVAAPLLKVLERVDVLVGHNLLTFDVPLVLNELKRVGVTEIKRFPTVIVDTIEARWATPDGKMPNLGELCWSLGMDYDPAQAHAASYDVERSLACYREAVRLGEIEAPKIQQRQAA